MENLWEILFPKLLLGDAEYYKNIQHGPQRVKHELREKPFDSLYRELSTLY